MEVWPSATTALHSINRIRDPDGVSAAKRRVIEPAIKHDPESHSSNSYDKYEVDGQWGDKAENSTTTTTIMVTLEKSNSSSGFSHHDSIGASIAVSTGGRTTGDRSNMGISELDQAQFEADKRAVYKHPLFPLLALLFERCELATQSSEIQSSDSFNLDIQAFVQHQERDHKPFLTNDPEIDGLMIKAIQVLRIHLLELEKVQELCKDFCNRYITCLKGKMQSENLLRSDYCQSGAASTSGSLSGAPLDSGNLINHSESGSNSNSPIQSYAVSPIQHNVASQPSSNGTSHSEAYHMSDGAPPQNVSSAHLSSQHSTHSTHSTSSSDSTVPTNLSGPLPLTAPPPTGIVPNPAAVVAAANLAYSAHHVAAANAAVAVQHHQQMAAAAAQSIANYSTAAALNSQVQYGADSIIHGSTPLGQIGVNLCPPLPTDTNSLLSGPLSPAQTTSNGSADDCDSDFTSRTNSSLRDGHKQKRGVLPKHATSVMRSWLFQHLIHPYPTEDEKRHIAAQTNLTLLQVNNWFINARRRILQPMLDANGSSENTFGQGNPKKKSSSSSKRYWPEGMGLQPQLAEGMLSSSDDECDSYSSDGGDEGSLVIDQSDLSNNAGTHESAANRAATGSSIDGKNNLIPAAIPSYSNSSESSEH